MTRKRGFRGSELLVVFLVLLGLATYILERAVTFVVEHWVLVLVSVAALAVIWIKLILPELAKRRVEEQRRTSVAPWWHCQDGRSLEHETGRLFKLLGYSVRETGGANDEGVDLVLARAGEHVIVQCKAHTKPIGPSVVRELYGALHHHKANRAVLVSPFGFTEAAKSFAENKPIELLDAEGLAAKSESVLQMFHREKNQ
ncbi:MAG: restriction endonuclease [Acidobacteria bacterium]|nr:restriction endonuclease [Acidobacteriota bacterium]